MINNSVQSFPHQFFINIDWKNMLFISFCVKLVSRLTNLFSDCDSSWIFDKILYKKLNFFLNYYLSSLYCSRRPWDCVTNTITTNASRPCKESDLAHSFNVSFYIRLYLYLLPPLQSDPVIPIRQVEAHVHLAFLAIVLIILLLKYSAYLFHIRNLNRRMEIAHILFFIVILITTGVYA